MEPRSIYRVFDVITAIGVVAVIMVLVRPGSKGPALVTALGHAFESAAMGVEGATLGGQQPPPPAPRSSSGGSSSGGSSSGSGKKRTGNPLDDLRSLTDPLILLDPFGALPF